MHSFYIKYTIIIAVLILVLIPLSMIFIPKLNYRALPHGLCDGKLDESKPNWVSSLISESDKHYIPPLDITSLASLADSIKENLEDTHITHLGDSHLIAYRQSQVFHFTDWLCVQADGNVSASATMGHYDFNKNREWVTKIRDLIKT